MSDQHKTTTSTLFLCFTVVMFYVQITCFFSFCNRCKLVKSEVVRKQILENHILVKPYVKRFLQKLQHTIEQCLIGAAAKGFTSMAFGYMGIGISDAADVCHIMYKTTVRWACENPDKSLKTIQFVLPPSDRDLIKVRL